MLAESDGKNRDHLYLNPWDCGPVCHALWTLAGYSMTMRRCYPINELLRLADGTPVDLARLHLVHLDLGLA